MIEVANKKVEIEGCNVETVKLAFKCCHDSSNMKVCVIKELTELLYFCDKYLFEKLKVCFISFWMSKYIIVF